MNKRNFEQLNFNNKFRISQRTIFMALLQIIFAIIWRTTPIQIMFWILMPLICILGWMASFGWKTALRELRFWLEQITREDF